MNTLNAHEKSGSLQWAKTLIRSSAGYKRGRLTQRTRSFKDELLEKCKWRSSYDDRSAPQSSYEMSCSYVTTTQLELEELWRQTDVALKHLRDVIVKQKLEMLAGNATIVLDMVWLINLAVNSALGAVFDSNALMSAIMHMRQSTANLIKLCDDATLDVNTTDLSDEHVNEIISQLEESIRKLIRLVCDRIPKQSSNIGDNRTETSNSAIRQESFPPELKFLRSEPDNDYKITRTSPNKRDTFKVDADVPPPKPPLPEGNILNTHTRPPQDCAKPPPLPPKKNIGKINDNERKESSTTNTEFFLPNDKNRLSLKPNCYDASVSSLSIDSIDEVDNSFHKFSLSQSNDNDDEDNQNAVVQYYRHDNETSNSSYSCDESSCSSNIINFTNTKSFYSYHRFFNTEYNTFSCEADKHTIYKECNVHNDEGTTMNSTCIKDSECNTNKVPGLNTLNNPFLSNTSDKFSNLKVQKIENEQLEHHHVHYNSSEVLVASKMHKFDSNDKEIEATPPPLPPKKRHVMAYMEMFGNCSHANEPEYLRHSTYELPPEERKSSGSFLTSMSSEKSVDSSDALPTFRTGSFEKPPALPPKQLQRRSTKSKLEEHRASIKTDDTDTETSINDENLLQPALETNIYQCEEIDLIEKIDVTDWLLKKLPDDDGPEIRGGTVDALVVHATKSSKSEGTLYQDVFLTTYRTFITPADLTSKLIQRYNYFYYQPEHKARSRETFALLTRVVGELTSLDLIDTVQRFLMCFVQQLISSGELTLAKVLRVKYIQRHELMRSQNKDVSIVVQTLLLGNRNVTLLDFKSEQIAEQMTLLDSYLFFRIEIPEVLLWAQEQNEERSPNLTCFTEHFNKMSYWVRTRILTATSKDLREKYFCKFIKIMKHLRKLNNFNSYLALLSALDSAPVRRLEWQKHANQNLKEYCTLIDSSSSFRAYRQVLSETQPPCIPYIGLILQDLTFVHIGNSDYFSDGKVNFSKRWQQFNIVNNMKKFKKEDYKIVKNDGIMQLFNNFNEFIGEDAMWQLSETIKPRGNKKK